MIKEQLVIVFENQSVSRDDAWASIASYLVDYNLAEDTYEISGQDVPFQNIGNTLKRRGKPTFLIYGKILKLYLVVVGFLHDTIRIEGPSNNDWDALITRIQSVGNFVHAYLVDCDYDNWQNAQDPLEYNSHNRSYEELPMKSNGLPYPLEQSIIDTSKNPGRYALRKGFIEAIGSPMWLGERFWKLTQADPQSLKSLPISVETVQNITRVSLGGPITDATDVKIQEDLRSRLFPSSKGD